MKPTIGFIGQGYVGKNCADDFEQRGFSVVRYSLEEPYLRNKERVGQCDIVFVVVPTPSIPGKGGDDHIVREVISLVENGKIIVIKSTVLPGTTESLQNDHPSNIILHSPEFLTAGAAQYDAAHPTRNIIGISERDEKHTLAAEQVLSVLPQAPFSLICSARESELIKYMSNCYLFTKVVFANVFYDIAHLYACDWKNVIAGVGSDPRIGPSHLEVMDASKHAQAKAGRGAGGLCLPKDFAALRLAYEALSHVDKKDLAVLQSLEEKNNELLVQSGKDIDILTSIYGKDIPGV